MDHQSSFGEWAWQAWGVRTCVGALSLEGLDSSSWALTLSHKSSTAVAGLGWAGHGLGWAGFGLGIGHLFPRDLTTRASTLEWGLPWRGLGSCPSVVSWAWPWENWGWGPFLGTQIGWGMVGSLAVACHPWM